MYYDHFSFPQLASLLWTDCDLLLLLEILNSLPLQTLVSTWTASSCSFFVESLVEAFYYLLSSPDNDETDNFSKLVGVKYCKSIMRQIVDSCPEQDGSKAAFAAAASPSSDKSFPPFNASCLAVYYLVDRALSPPFCTFLGGSNKCDVRPKNAAASSSAAETSLLEENMRMTSGLTNMVRPQSTLYKSSVLNLNASSAKKKVDNGLLENDNPGLAGVDTDYNQMVLIEFLEVS
jgi:hypothetical protein